MARVIGVLLAAGAGSRMGRPKALVTHDDGTPWLVTARRVLLDGGCSDVVTVLGAQARQAYGLIPRTWTVIAADWQRGMSASLAVGLDEVAGQAGARHVDVAAVMIHLIDLPDVNADVVHRLLPHAQPQTLARAVYDGALGHPVLIGRDHWSALTQMLSGDRGARDYLAQHEITAVECGDLAGGKDVDTMPDVNGPMLDL